MEYNYANKPQMSNFFASETEKLRTRALFGEERNFAEEFAECCSFNCKMAEQYYLLAIGFLEQAERSFKLAAMHEELKQIK